jgi:uncharacterized delta-60 repeat protein
MRTISGFLILLLSGLALADAPRDGLLDPSFGAAGVALVERPASATWRFERLRGMALQPDGKVLLLGSVREAAGGTFRPVVVRLGTDGALDSSFGTGGIAVVDVPGAQFANGLVAHQAVVFAGGRIVVIAAVVANVPSLAFNGCVAVFALDGSGQLEAQFGPAPGPACIDLGAAGFDTFTEPPGAVAALAAGGLIIGGPAASAVQPFSAAVRLTADGLLDTTFGTGGVRAYGGAFSGGSGRKPGIALRSGSFFAGGASAGLRGVFASDADLAPSAGFGSAGFGGGQWAAPTIVNELFSFDVDVAGRVILAGIARTSFDAIACNFCVTRLTAAGVVDQTFNPTGGLPGSVLLTVPGSNSLVVRALARSDGRVLLVGYSYEGTTNPENPDVLLVSRRTDGDADARFGDPATAGMRIIDIGPGRFDITGDAALQPDGRIVVAAGSRGPDGWAYSASRLLDDAVSSNGFE